MPVVLDTKDYDNLLLIGAGHGAQESLLWDENLKTITGDFMSNLLLMTAANDKETSKAELYAPLWNTYLSNSFTMAMLETLQGENYYDLSIRDLYSEAFSKTMGSHVTLYNMESFGNVFFNYIFEYFVNSNY